ncbi:MAG: ATP-binding protein [Bacteroidia bacterium]|nr:ATP-binding protein [Bacteroidia bacterium]
MNSSNADMHQVLYKQLELESRPEVIRAIEAVIDELRQELEFKDDVYGNVMIAVTEAINNAVFHGNKGDSSRRIFVDFETYNQYRLLVRVRDEGDGFDPDALADPTAPENIGNIGGRGVFLMRHLSDELIFRDQGRVVELIFNI